MKAYVACDNPEHDRFSHRKEDCRECTPSNPGIDATDTPNPGIGPLGAMYFSKLTSTQVRCTELLEENRSLKARIAELENGLIIKGWKCTYCKAFVGEEKEIHLECIWCDKPRART